MVRLSSTVKPCSRLLYRTMTSTSLGRVRYSSEPARWRTLRSWGRSACSGRVLWCRPTCGVGWLPSITGAWCSPLWGCSVWYVGWYQGDVYRRWGSVTPVWRYSDMCGAGFRGLSTGNSSLVYSSYNPDTGLGSLTRTSSGSSTMLTLESYRYSYYYY